jgi:hypothetical protein
MNEASKNQRRQHTPPPTALPAGADRRLIAAQARAGFFAADRIIFLYRPDIHTQHTWEVTDAGIIAGRDEMASEGAVDLTASPMEQIPLPLQLVALKADLTPARSSDASEIIASAIEVAEHIEGPVAGRIVRILYRIANDPPYLRHPRITVDLNQLLDELGYARAVRGYHDAQNRARVRDVLLALSRVEIRGERFDGAGGREFYAAPLISIRGGYYREEETRTIDLAQLLEHGLPNKLHIELGWYEGVRRRDGRLGNNYVLLPRTLSAFQDTGHADHLATEDRLLEFLWLRYSLQRGQSLAIVLTLEVALRRAGITNKNISRARQTLQQALERLRIRQHIANYSPLPKRRPQSFTVVLQLPQAQGAPPPLDAPEALPPTPDLEVIEPEGGGELGELAEAPARAAYMQVMCVGSRSLSAQVIWQTLKEAAKTQLPGPLQMHLASSQPLWRADTLTDGDVRYWLYLGVPRGLVLRVQAAEPILGEIAGNLWDHAFGVLVGPEHHPDTPEEV